MKCYSWTPAYVAAIEEHDRVALQKRIGIARHLMSERLAMLGVAFVTNSDSEEFQRLCDACRCLDLLERVSNGNDLFARPEERESA